MAFVGKKINPRNNTTQGKALLDHLPKRRENLKQQGVVSKHT